LAKEPETLKLMNQLSDSDIDHVILSVTPTLSRKVAYVIARSAEILGDRLPQGEAGLELVAARVEALVERGQLEAFGDIKKWRFSEVQRPTRLEPGVNP